MKSSYPIIKYPESIEQKLKNQQSVEVFTEEIDSDHFDQRSNQNIQSHPPAIHKNGKTLQLRSARKSH